MDFNFLDYTITIGWIMSFILLLIYYVFIDDIITDYYRKKRKEIKHNNEELQKERENIEYDLNKLFNR